jgi:hypothetical protein
LHEHIFKLARRLGFGGWNRTRERCIARSLPIVLEDWVENGEWRSHEGLLIPRTESTKSKPDSIDSLHTNKSIFQIYRTAQDQHILFLGVVFQVTFFQVLKSSLGELTAE